MKYHQSTKFLTNIHLKWIDNAIFIYIVYVSAVNVENKLTINHKKTKKKNMDAASFIIVLGILILGFLGLYRIAKKTFSVPPCDEWRSIGIPGGFFDLPSEETIQRAFEETHGISLQDKDYEKLHSFTFTNGLDSSYGVHYFNIGIRYPKQEKKLAE